MHNTFFISAIAFFLAVPARAQFYTIARESKNTSEVIVEKLQTIETQIIMDVDSVLNDTVSEYFQEIEFSRPIYALARKRNVRNSRKNRNFGSWVSTAKLSESRTSRLPKLTIPNLIREIRLNKIQHEEVVLAQAILETGWFTSSVCRNKNNLFGLTNPRTGQYYEFNHWTESVAAYYSKVQYRYKGGNYLRWLDKIGYAEAENYVQSLIRIIRQLRQ